MDSFDLNDGFLYGDLYCAVEKQIVDEINLKYRVFIEGNQKMIEEMNRKFKLKKRNLN